MPQQYLELTIQYDAKKFPEPVWAVTDYESDFFVDAKSGKLIEKAVR